MYLWLNWVNLGVNLDELRWIWMTWGGIVVNWVKLDWFGLDWVELGWIWKNLVELGWIEWIGWIGWMDWNGWNCWTRGWLALWLSWYPVCRVFLEMFLHLKIVEIVIMAIRVDIAEMVRRFWECNDHYYDNHWINFQKKTLMFSIIVLMSLMVRMTIMSLKAAITFVIASSIKHLLYRTQW